MEQARYWMFPKTRNPDPNPQTFPVRPTNPFGDSWEEQAFAEDAAGALGGSVWPPASYSCTFCLREFRSAQALGGHMNVHRRDRARLKQADLVPPAEVVPPDHALSTCTSQICTFLKGNPNPELPGPRSPVTRVSFNGEDLRNDQVFVGPASWSSFVAGKRDREISGLEENEKRKFKNVVEAIESWPEKEEYCVTGGDMPVGFNLLIFRTQTRDGEVGGGKRRRVGENPSSLIPTVSVIDRCAAQPEALKLCPRSAEELDLELRLGFA